jgi:hypothetical protein
VRRQLKTLPQSGRGGRELPQCPTSCRPDARSAPVLEGLLPVQLGSQSVCVCVLLCMCTCVSAGAVGQSMSVFSCVSSFHPSLIHACLTHSLSFCPYTHTHICAPRQRTRKRTQKNRQRDRQTATHLCTKSTCVWCLCLAQKSGFGWMGFQLNRDQGSWIGIRFRVEFSQFKEGSRKQKAL